MGFVDFQKKTEMIEKRRILFKNAGITCILCDQPNAGVCGSCAAPLCEGHKKIDNVGRLVCPDCFKNLFRKR